MKLGDRISSWFMVLCLAQLGDAVVFPTLLDTDALQYTSQRILFSFYLFIFQMKCNGIYPSQSFTCLSPPQWPLGGVQMKSKGRKI